MSYASYVIKRISSSIFVLWAASIIIFSIIRLVPGDPAAAAVAGEVHPTVVENLRIEMGLHLPVWQQYLAWISDILLLDMGTSMMAGFPIITLLEVRLPRSLSLAFAAILIACCIALPLGILGALNRNSKRDYATLVFSQLGISTPSFLLGILLILIFAGHLGLLPARGYIPITESVTGWARHMILPAVALGVINAAVITRFVRSEMLDVLGQDYIETAKAFGHPEKRINRKYALKNAMIPTTTVVALRFGGIIGGTVVIETVFNFPGIGMLILDSLFARDYQVLQISILFVAAAFIFINLIVDLLYGFLDPRIKY